MSLLKVMNQTCLLVDLTKNGGNIYNDLMMQTLAYGKTSDCLTDRRLLGLA
ncbi:MAG: hypothetical protein KAG28_04985 [Cocleimonas sp.]|nr:hypothetical protein [Cocleimonas sp.]